jgi:chromosome partitioning protein
MTTIAVVSQKGGTGKTTLAIHLAAAAERNGDVALIIDADPQATASMWSDWREGAPPEVIDSAPSRIAAKVEQAKTAGATFIVIDTPPHADITATRAVEVADIVLIPCRPNAFDLAAVITTASLVRLLHKPAFIVFSAGPPNAPKIYADAAALMQQRGIALAPHRTPYRAVFRHATALGKTVFEIGPPTKAVREMEQLSMWIREQAHMATCEHIKVFGK